jgi:hypothetical protein
MLYKTEIALKIDQKHSEYFEIFRGVKQGDSTSYLSFISNFNLLLRIALKKFATQLIKEIPP